MFDLYWQIRAKPNFYAYYNRFDIVYTFCRGKKEESFQGFQKFCRDQERHTGKYQVLHPITKK